MVSNLEVKCSCNRRLIPVALPQDVNKPLPKLHYSCPKCLKESKQCNCPKIDLRFRNRTRTVDDDFKLTPLERKLLKETCDYS